MRVKRLVAAAASLSLLVSTGVTMASPAQARWTNEVVGGGVEVVEWATDTETDPTCVDRGDCPEREVPGSRRILPAYVIHNSSQNGGYQPLQYGKTTTFRIGDSNTTIAPQTVSVPSNEWQVRETGFIGQKSNLVGVRWSASQRCDFSGKTTGGGTLIYDTCGAWNEKYDWDRVDLSMWGDNIGTQWAMNGVAGRGICAVDFEGRSRGPLAPGLTADTSARMPATKSDDKTLYTDSDYAFNSGIRNTFWGDAIAQNNVDEATFLYECYEVPRDKRIGARLSLDGYSSGRYLNEVKMNVNAVRVLEFRGDAGRLSRAYLPTAGKYVYTWSLAVPNALMDATAGRVFNPGNLATSVYYSTTAAALWCNDRSWQENFSGPDKSLESVWADANWPDGGRTSFYYASECDPPIDLPPPTSRSSQPQGDLGAGITGVCLFAEEDPVVANPNAGLTATAGPTGVIEVKADNDISALDFAGDQVDIWVNDNRGAGYSRDMSVTTVDNDYRNVFGTLDREIPGTVSPSWIGTFDGGTSEDIAEMNTPEGQPYATVPWDDIDAQQDKRTAGVWEDLDKWIGVGSGRFPPGFGVGFDEPSSPGNYWGIQTRWRVEGTFQMKPGTVGLTGNTVDWVNGKPVPKRTTTTSTGAVQWVSQTFQCDSKPLYLSARDIRVGPGF